MLLLLLLHTFHSNITDRRRLWLNSLERHQGAQGPVKPPNRPLPPRQHKAIWQIKAGKANKLAHGDGFPSAQQKKKPWGATERSDPIAFSASTTIAAIRRRGGFTRSDR